MKKNEEKTNVIRILEQNKINFKDEYDKFDLNIFLKILKTK